MREEIIQLFSDNTSDPNSFFKKHETTLKTNVEVFKFLKQRLKETNPSNDVLFQWVFSAFYGMPYISRHKRPPFFEKMQEINDNCDDLNAQEITENLAPLMGKKYFSFVTKMLNLIDDEKYPIYDSNVGLVFEKKHKPCGKNYQMSVYQDIIDTYNQLKDKPIVDEFKSYFSCPDIGYMKILDSIFWIIGKDMKN